MTDYISPSIRLLCLPDRIVPYFLSFAMRYATYVEKGTLCFLESGEIKNETGQLISISPYLLPTTIWIEWGTDPRFRFRMVKPAEISLLEPSKASYPGGISSFELCMLPEAKSTLSPSERQWLAICVYAYAQKEKTCQIRWHQEWIELQINQQTHRLHSKHVGQFEGSCYLDDEGRLWIGTTIDLMPLNEFTFQIADAMQQDAYMVPYAEQLAHILETYKSWFEQHEDLKELVFVPKKQAILVYANHQQVDFFRGALPFGVKLSRKGRVLVLDYAV